MVATAGDNNDIDVSKLTLTGQDGATYTHTSPNVEITSDTQFTVTLNAVDQLHVEGLLNKDGTDAVDTTPYNIAAAADWNPIQSGHADLTGNGVTVSNVCRTHHHINHLRCHHRHISGHRKQLRQSQWRG